MKQIVSISFFAILPIIILFIEKRITVFNIGIFIFGILLINKGIRFIPDSIFILTPNFIESFSAREYLSNCSFFKHRKYFVLLAILYICHVHFLSYKDKSSSFISGFGINKKALPVEASLKLNPLKDRIFNSFSIGGYLIWKFDGKLKVFQDGRIHAYPFYFFNEINDACNDEDLWFLLLNKYNINTVILDKSESSLSQMTSLKKNSWKYRYEDENFIVASKHEI